MQVDDLIKMVQISEKGSKSDWMFQMLLENSAQPHLSVENTVNRYVCHKISQIFTYFLSKINTNLNLATMCLSSSTNETESSRQRDEIWRYMLRNFTWNNIINWEKSTEVKMYAPFPAKFPFSYIFIPRLQELRQEVTHLAQKYV